MEATVFTGWISDELKPHAVELTVAYPAMLKAIGASKKKNDRVDAQKISDMLHAICCRNATWRRPGSGNYAACCDTAI
jgi:hypothetical protein